MRDWVAAGWQNIAGEINKLDARNFTVDGNTVTERFDDNPARIRALGAWRDKRNGWIKAEQLQPGSVLPLSVDEIEELYRLNELIPSDDERDLGGQIPPIECVPSDHEFAGLASRIRHLESLDLGSHERLWAVVTATAQDLATLRCQVLSALTILDSRDQWLRECIEAGLLGGDYRVPWDDLVTRIEEFRRKIVEWNSVVITRGPKVKPKTAPADPKRTCEEILARLRLGKKLSGWFSTYADVEWKKLVSASTVDGRQPKDLEDFEAIYALLSIYEEREQVRRRWDRQLMPLGCAVPEANHSSPEDFCVQFLPRIREGLAWYDQTWGACQRQFESMGIPWSLLRQRVPPATAACANVQALKTAAHDQLLPMIERRELLLELQQLQTKQNEILMAWRSIRPKDHPGEVVTRLREAASGLDAKGYAQAWSRLAVLNQQCQPFQRRSELLTKLQTSASGWAMAIQRRTPRHYSSQGSGDLEQAWLHRQWVQEIEHRAAPDIDKLQQELTELKDRLQDTTSKFVNCRTWAAQRKRIGLPQQQALVG